MLDYLIQLRYVYSGIVAYVVINTHMYVTRYEHAVIHIGRVTYLRTHVLTHICTYQYICTYAYVRTHVCRHKHTHNIKHTYTCTYMCVFISLCTYAHTRTYTCTLISL